MANTLFGAMSGVRPVNWRLLIHEVVGRAIPNIGRKPSYLSPFILHLYMHYNYITADEEDLLTIAAEEVTYKVHPAVADSSTSSDPIIPDTPPSSPRIPPPPERTTLPSEFPETRLSPTSSSSASSFKTWAQSGVHVAERGPLRIGISGKSLQARPRRTGGAPDPLLPAGTHHQRGQPSVGRMRTWKHPPGDSKEGGPEEGGPGKEGARPSPDEKRTPTRAGGRHGRRTRAEERGDPEVPRKADGGLQPDPVTHWASGRNRKQGPAVQPAGGIRRPSFRQTDYSHHCEILTDDE